MSTKIKSHEQAMNRYMSAKTLQNGCSKQEIKSYFLHSFTVYEKLFTYIKNQSSFYTKPEPLRHPLIFYYGHTACLYVNKLFDKGLISERVNPYFQSIFAVGVDEMDWDDLNENHYDWPSVRQVTIYRQTVKKIVLDVIDKINPEISWNSDAWIIMMGIQHQRIHLETSSVIIRRLPIDEIRPHQDFIQCPKFTTHLQDIPKNQMKQVPKFQASWDRQIENASIYGWDNQFGQRYFDVKAFKMSSMLVSNGQFLQFVKENGYQILQYWDEQGKAWLKSIKPKMPLFWSEKNGEYTLRTMNKIMPLPMDWPAEVNNLEATAFCKWKSIKVGKQLRLPTQDEYYALRSLMPKDQLDWIPKQVGNVNMEYWFSPNPVDFFKIGDFYDIIGNVWQHCSTPIFPFEKFEIHPIYEDFTTPTFDGRHFMIKGGSFVSTGNEATKHARYAFRRHFYQFAGFRYVESQNSVFNNQLIDESDQIVEKFLKMHYTNPKSYVNKVIDIVGKKYKNLDEKCLNVGCSVGRVVLQLSKYFKQSYGTDYSARFFQMATRLYDKGFLSYKNIDISLEDMQIDRNRVVLYQMNPQNPDPKKINGFGVVVMDGLAIKQNRMKNAISCMKKVMKKEVKLMIINGANRNNVSEEELKQIFSKVQIEDKYLVSSSQDQDFDVEIRLFQVEI